MMLYKFSDRNEKIYWKEFKNVDEARRFAY